MFYAKDRCTLLNIQVILRSYRLIYDILYLLLGKLQDLATSVVIFYTFYI